MTEVEITDELYARLSTIATDLSEFETTDDLVEFALETVATDLEQTTVGEDTTRPAASKDDNTADTESDDDSEEDDDAVSADDTVEERLGDLGYL